MFHRHLVTGVLLCMLSAMILTASAGPVFAEATKTQLVQQDGHWQLLRDGRPYFIKGAGGSGSLQLLKDMGGNSVRTWGADETLGKQLDQAQRLGLSVCVGIWLAQERDKWFDYNNPKDLAQQVQQVRETVLKYKDHPAVLMWGIGNELEGFGQSDNAPVWQQVEKLAAMTKKLDPNHPTMAVVAEIGGTKVQDINRYCPDIDIVGINSYAGCDSLPQRYPAAGGTKPYVVTEFGPIGTWEAGKTTFGALIEPTSTEKAAMYQRSYAGGIASQEQGLCLGSYAFLWGWKQEGTATWFGMLLPDGDKLAAVDTMSQCWTGHPVSNPCPAIQPVAVQGSNVVAPGATVHASVKVDEPGDHPLRIEWQLHPETGKHGVGGDAEATTDALPDAIATTQDNEVELHMPAKPGLYRLFAYARDDQNSAATANVPLLVQMGGENDPQDIAPSDNGNAPATQPAAKTPVSVLFGPNGNTSGYIPSGWMGNTTAISMDEKCTTNPHDGKYCIKAQYKAADNWGGVVWQNPTGNWGDQAGGKDLSKAKKLTFWARGDNGGENVQFKFGIIGSDKKYSDTGSGDTTVTLTKDWQPYSIDLDGKDLSRIVTGFCWVAAGQGSPITFYLDDIEYVP